MKLLLGILAGYMIGRIYSYYQNRVQCVNCGSYNTKHGSYGFGGCGGTYEYAVKHYEGHECKDCGKITSLKMNFNKDGK